MLKVCVTTGDQKSMSSYLPIEKKSMSSGISYSPDRMTVSELRN